METVKFQALIRAVTGRDFSIKTDDSELIHEKEYRIERILPITERAIRFYWKTPKTDEKLLRSFITAFTSKYREPNPESYDYEYGGKQYKWEEKTLEEREYAYSHHVSNMYSKQALLGQIEANFGKSDILSALIRFGFYPTEYGIGIFCFFYTPAVSKAIQQLKSHLNKANIPYSNEYSDARWVYRFKLGLSKPVHAEIIGNLS